MLTITTVLMKLASWAMAVARSIYAAVQLVQLTIMLVSMLARAAR